MPRKRKTTPESTEEAPKERKFTDEQICADEVTKEMCLDERLYKVTFAMNIKHLYELCRPKNGGKAYLPQDVIGCWRNLRSDESVAGFRMDDAKLITVLKGNPPYIERWTEWMMDLPPVYESYGHDKAVRDRADFLRRHDFHYGATGLPNRLTAEAVQELGL